MTIVKICGITNIEDAQAATDAGADMLGFIFFPRSPRYITPERAREIIDTIHHSHSRSNLHTIRTVGVFVNEPLAQVQAIMETANLELAQLHGKETPEMLQTLGLRAFKTLQANDLDTAQALMANYRSAVNGNRPAFIVDAPPAQLPGGNGIVADWSVARTIATQFPIMLAGGLTVENVQAAIQIVQPYGVDVSSGVERAPGLKNHARVQEFIQRVKQ